MVKLNYDKDRKEKKMNTEIIKEKSHRILEMSENIEQLNNEQLELLIVDMAELNAEATKGHLDNHSAFYYDEIEKNDIVYSVKNKVVRLLVQEFMKRNLDVSIEIKGGRFEVIYFRCGNGVQISFHYPSFYISQDDLFSELPYGTWDGIEKSYTYYNNPDNYAQELGKIRIEEKRREQVQQIILKKFHEKAFEDIQKVYEYLRKYKRSLKYGISDEDMEKLKNYKQNLHPQNYSVPFIDCEDIQKICITLFGTRYYRLFNIVCEQLDTFFAEIGYCIRSVNGDVKCYKIRK